MLWTSLLMERRTRFLARVPFIALPYICRFCSGAEDGYVRIHHLSEEYFRFVEKEERTRPDPAAAVKAD
jgi:hypothetical protein